MGILDSITGAFSFLKGGSQKEQRVIQYAIREHHRGRGLKEILDDRFVTNRLSPEQIRRLLDHPELIHALGEDHVSSARSGPTG